MIYILLFLFFTLNADRPVIPKDKIDLSKVPTLSSLKKKPTKNKATSRPTMKVSKARPIKSKKPYISHEVKKILKAQYNHPALLNNKISITLKKASIDDAIELISKSAGINFVVDSGVSGVVKNISLKNVSVAHALKAILSNNDPELTLKRESGICRIMPLDKVATRLQARFDELSRDSFVKSSITMQHISFNKDIKDRITSMWKGISGSHYKADGTYIVLDDASKKVFIRGRNQHVADMQDYLEEIDVPLPQVKIEARVVIARKDFDESLGLHLSGIYKNGTGSTQVGSNDKSSGINMMPGLINRTSKASLPFVFGGKNLDTRSLNLVLSAAESRGELKTILKPSILTNHGEESKISVGDSLPIETVIKESVEGTLRDVTTVTYKDVGTILKVKPLVAPNKKMVSLDIFVENSTHVTQDRYPIITSARTKCRVMLNDGQTGMIGGLIERSKKTNKTAVPLLGEIPVVGNLFKGSHKEDKDHQLLIFITPTIA